MNRIPHILFPLFLIFILAALPLRAQYVLEGTWHGVAELPSASIGVTVCVTPLRSGYTATIAPLYRGANRYQFKDINMVGAQVTAQVKGRNFEFEGHFVSADRIEGTGTHGVNSFPLVFERLPRPQTPRQPFPYVSTDVAISSESSDIILAGTLQQPSGGASGAPRAAVLLLNASGPHNRDNEMFGHKMYQVLADRLARAGFVVLRYDDRGVGTSSGVFAQATLEDHYADAAMAYQWLRSQPSVATNQVFVLGHSRGAVLAEMLGAIDATPAGLVLLSAPTMPMVNLLLEQRKTLLSTQQVPEQNIRQDQDFNRFLYSRAMADQEITDSIKETIKGQIETFLKSKDPDISETQIKLVMTRSLGLITDKWFRTYIKEDPRAYILRLRCPVLALYGSKDLMVSAERNASLLQQLLPPAEVEIIPNLNHLLQPTEGPGLPAEYQFIPITMSDKVIQRITQKLLDWRKKTSK